jgi:uncharacterized protein (TIGR02594 family)
MNEPLLLRVARLCEGLSEVAGDGNNAVILKWAKDIGAPAYTADSIPWCAVAMNRWMLACGYPLSGKGFELLRAKSFESWGVPLVVPSFGCVMTFRRPEGAHVGLYLGERADAYYILGANQSNSVSVTWIAKDRLTSMRWPMGLPAHEGRVLLNAAGAVSVNEQ